jgi:hypothetical protein
MGQKGHMRAGRTMRGVSGRAWGYLGTVIAWLRCSCVCFDVGGGLIATLMKQKQSNRCVVNQ